MPNSPDQVSGCIYYAIGDVHGEADRLARLHEAILEHHRAFYFDASQVIVHLGDYVDRGPNSCAVIEQIISLEAAANADAALTIVNLRGNHEQQMLDALDDPDGPTMRTWKRKLIGGKATLKSYEQRGSEGEELLLKHRSWLNGLPSIWRPEDAPYIFVHAGIDPERFPTEEASTYLWTRSRTFFKTSKWSNPLLAGQTIVHGHTPTEDDTPDISESGAYRRINVDTGAVFGGPLTCAVLNPEDDRVRFLYA